MTEREGRNKEKDNETPKKFRLSSSHLQELVHAALGKYPPQDEIYALAAKDPKELQAGEPERIEEFKRELATLSWLDTRIEIDQESKDTKEYWRLVGYVKLSEVQNIYGSVNLEEQLPKELPDTLKFQFQLWITMGKEIGGNLFEFKRLMETRTQSMKDLLEKMRAVFTLDEPQQRAQFPDLEEQFNKILKSIEKDIQYYMACFRAVMPHGKTLAEKCKKILDASQMQYNKELDILNADFDERVRIARIPYMDGLLKDPDSNEYKEAKAGNNEVVPPLRNLQKEARNALKDRFSQQEKPYDQVVKSMQLMRESLEKMQQSKQIFVDTLVSAKDIFGELDPIYFDRIFKNLEELYVTAQLAS